MKDYRRISTKRLILKLGLDNYRNVGPLTKHEFRPKKVVLPLKQHTGAPAVAQVKVGDKVKVGDLLGKPAENALGARIHASIAGTVTAVDSSVTITA
jgi:Na+-translocating ferredoxin:NAD+ oxidoreductase RnfC subunit